MPQEEEKFRTDLKIFDLNTFNVYNFPGEEGPEIVLGQPKSSKLLGLNKMSILPLEIKGTDSAIILGYNPKNKRWYIQNLVDNPTVIRKGVRGKDGKGSCLGETGLNEELDPFYTYTIQFESGLPVLLEVKKVKQDTLESKLRK